MTVAVNGLVRIDRRGLVDYGTEAFDEQLDFEHARDDGDWIVLKCYDARAEVVQIRIHKDIAIEAVFGDVTTPRSET